jgi:uncharacterized tellurite resistance protein B-like protein
MKIESEHPLKKYSEKEKIAYLSIVATLVLADNNIADEEISNIRSLCKDIELSDEGIAKIISVTENPDTAPINEFIDVMRSSDLKYTLLCDMYFLAYADNKVELYELKHINDIGYKLNLSREQIYVIKRYVDAMMEAGKAEKSAEMKDLGNEVSSSLEAAMVPIEAVSLEVSIFSVAADVGKSGYLGVKNLFKKIF